MVSTKALLLLSVLLISIRAYDESDCAHDKIPQNPGTLFIEEDFSSAKSGERHLASYSNFRIYPFYDILDANSPSAFASYIKNKLIPPAVSYFQAALKIKYPVVGNLKLDSSVTKLCDYSTPSIFKSTGVPADIVIIYDSDTQSGTQIAATSQCYVASGSGRTLISQTMINRNMIPVTTDVLIHERNMYTLMHEMMHSFGFSSTLYPRFLDDNGNQRSGHIKKVTIAGSTRTVIDVPSLTEKLRTYYGCSTVPGLILENSGGSDTVSSHVERKFFVYDAMSSGSIFGRRFSQFSLGLLEASGWFVVDYSYAEPFFYGKGQGCSFVTGTCSSTSSQFDEFCTGSSRGCSPTGRGGGSCQSDSISDGCKYYFPSEDNDCENDNGGDYARFPSLETYGRSAGSKCFTGNLNSRNSNSPTSFCFKYSCSGSGSSTQLTINVGNNKVTCTQAGTKTIGGYYGSVDCPNPQEFCETVGKQYCPRNCMGRGSCVNNKCVCNSGYSGIDCALTA